MPRFVECITLEGRLERLRREGYTRSLRATTTQAIEGDHADYLLLIYGGDRPPQVVVKWRNSEVYSSASFKNQPELSAWMRRHGVRVGHNTTQRL